MGKRILALILMAVMMLTMGAQAVDAAFTNTELNSTYTFYVIKNY